MNKRLLILCALSAVAMSGCNKEIDITAKNFKVLCEMSGGEVSLEEAASLKCECSGVPCRSGVVCIEGGLICADSVKLSEGELCADEGKILCSNGYYTECLKKSGGLLEWSGQLRCPDGNSCKDSETCGECKDETVVCDEDNNLRTCVGGMWNVHECPLACGRDENNLSYKCLGKNEHCTASVCKNGELMVCSDGVVSEIRTCDVGNCNAEGDDCGECRNDETRCENDANGSGRSQECDSGAWAAAEDCAGNVSCTKNEKCGVCLNGDRKCDFDGEYDRMYRCEDGQWVADEFCRIDDETHKNVEYSCMITRGKDNDINSLNYELDEAGHRVFSACGECKNDDIRCVNVEDAGNKPAHGEVQRCVYGLWTRVNDCVNATGALASCNDTLSACGECLDKSVKCLDRVEDSGNARVVGALWECQAGHWQAKADGQCANDASCAALHQSCGVCANGEVKCETGDDGKGSYSTCVNGAWNAVNCPNEVTCDENSQCGACHAGAVQCTNSSDQIGLLQTCDVHGVWTNETCYTVDGLNASCAEDGTSCGVCVNGTTYCEDVDGKGVQHLCKNGAWLNDVGSACRDEASCRQDPADMTGKHMICGECQNGDKKCAADEKGIDRMYTCQSGVWTKDDADDNVGKVSCTADGKTLGVCKNGEQRCDNQTSGKQATETGLISTCEHGEWHQTSLCQDGQSHLLSCGIDAKLCGVCANGETRCHVDFKQVCVDGAWQNDSDQCQSMSCVMRDGKASCGECRNGDLQCNNGDDNLGILRVCVDGQWSNDSAKSCKATQSCGSEQVSCGQCVTGAKKCENDSGSHVGTQYQCEEGMWIEREICHAKTASGDAGSDSEDKHVSCDSVEQVCGVCLDGEIECYVRTNGATAIRECQYGHWVETERCEMIGDRSVACTADNKCGVCIEGSERCQNDMNHVGYREICRGGEWIDKQVCDDGWSCNDSSCGECIEGNVVCEENADHLGQRKVCKNGTWQTPVQCVDHNEAVSCSEKLGDCGVCLNGEQKCKEQNGHGFMMRCENGEWRETACGFGFGCNADGTDCAGCLEDSMTFAAQSDGTCKYSQCKNGKEIELGYCTKDHLGLEPVSCTKSSNEQLDGCGECFSGTSGCRKIGETYAEYTCSDGKYNIVTTCEHGCALDLKSCAQCTDGEIQCVSGMDGVGHMNQCVDGQWVDSKCPNDAVCVDDHHCADCKPGLTKCEPGQADDVPDDILGVKNKAKIFSCDGAGHWVEKDICSTSACDANGACAECISGELACRDDASGVGYRYACVEGHWEIKAPCPNQLSCRDNNTCGECFNGDKLCENDNALYREDYDKMNKDYSYTRYMYVSFEPLHGQIKKVCEHGRWKMLERVEICSDAQKNPVSCAANDERGYSLSCGECPNGKSIRQNRVGVGSQVNIYVCRGGHYDYENAEDSCSRNKVQTMGLKDKPWTSFDSCKQ